MQTRIAAAREARARSGARMSTRARAQAQTRSGAEEQRKSPAPRSREPGEKGGQSPRGTFRRARSVGRWRALSWRRGASRRASGRALMLRPSRRRVRQRWRDSQTAPRSRAARCSCHGWALAHTASESALRGRLRCLLSRPDIAKSTRPTSTPARSASPRSARPSPMRSAAA